MIMTHGALLSDQIWQLILKNILTNLFKNTVDMYAESKGGVS